MSNEIPPKAPRKTRKTAAKTKKPVLTAAQQQERRSAAARKAALARWSKERPPSLRAQKQALSAIPTGELTVEHYADRENPELSWAAAILKRSRSGKSQRRAAAQIFSAAAKNRVSPWTKMSPQERSEIARRGGIRRWAIWREERARLSGANPTSATSQSLSDDSN